MLDEVWLTIVPEIDVSVWKKWDKNMQVSLIALSTNIKTKTFILREKYKNVPKIINYYALKTYVCMYVCMFVCFWRNSSPVGEGLLIHEVSRSHTITHHSR
jgi:hypothetical protein